MLLSIQKLAKKQIYEINKEVEKARLLKASQAKKSEYGDSAKYVIFTAADKKGNDTDGKVKVTMNEELIQKIPGACRIQHAGHFRDFHER